MDTQGVRTSKAHKNRVILGTDRIKLPAREAGDLLRGEGHGNLNGGIRSDNNEVDGGLRCDDVD